jgi:hypothetical protein
MKRTTVLSSDAKNIRRLIEDNSLGEALDMLDQWSEKNGRFCWKEITLLKGRHHKICRARIGGCLSSSKISKIALYILDIVEKINNIHVEEPCLGLKKFAKSLKVVCRIVYSKLMR